MSITAASTSGAARSADSSAQGGILSDQLIWHWPFVMSETTQPDAVSYILKIITVHAAKIDRENATSDGSPIVPCGLIAWSLFNNTYSFTRNELNLNVNKKGISWKSDRDHKFGDDVFPKNFQTGTLIGSGRLNPNISLNKQEDLIVWLRTAALPTFRKLYGKIEVDLEANNVITVVLLNNYNTHSFGGKKKLVLSTTSLLGGKNDFLGIAYLTVGSLCLFLAMATFIIYLVKPRQLGDPSYLSWNRNPSGH